MERTPISPRPLVYAHRGDRTRARDNTIEAFTLAVEAGADGIELDVRSTADGVLVVAHDPSVPGLPPFADVSFRQLRDADPAVPTLAEALAAIPSAVFVNVEVKNEMTEAAFDPQRELAKRTVEQIRSADDPSRILLSSFDPGSLERFRSEGPDMLRGQLVAGAIGGPDAIELGVHVGADAIHPPMSTLARDPHGMVRAADDAGLAVVVWNANTEAEVADAAEAGVAVIITDDPGMARRVLDQR